MYEYTYIYTFLYIEIDMDMEICLHLDMDIDLRSLGWRRDKDLFALSGRKQNRFDHCSRSLGASNLIWTF